MRSFSALRLGSHVLFCFAVLSFFRPFCQDLQLFWLLSGLVLLAALIAGVLEHPLLRLLPALLPALALLSPCESRLSFALACAIAFYAALVMVYGRFCPEAWVYRRESIWQLALSGVLSFISFFQSSGTQTLWILIAECLLVLLALRLLQNSASMGLAWQAESLGMLFAVIGIGLCASMLILAIWPLFFRVLAGIAGALASVVVFFVLIVNWIADLMRKGEDAKPLTDYYQQYFGNFEIGSPEQQAANNRPNEPPVKLPNLQVDVPWTQILMGLVIVVLLILGVCILLRGGLRRLRRVSTEPHNDLQAQEDGPNRAMSKEEKENREQIRILYNSYLEYLKTRGVRLARSDTTEEVTDATSRLFVQTDETLRNLYRKTRYSSQSLSREELQLAKACYDRLLSAENVRTEPAKAVAEGAVP